MTQNTENSLRTITFDGPHASAWPEARESLGLNPAGPSAVAGVEEVEERRDESDLFTESVTVGFASEDALDRARERLFEQAREMFDYGIHDDAGDVQDLASALPTDFEELDT